MAGMTLDATVADAGLIEATGRLFAFFIAATSGRGRNPFMDVPLAAIERSWSETSSEHSGYHQEEGVNGEEVYEDDEIEDSPIEEETDPPAATTNNAAAGFYGSLMNFIGA